MSFKICALACLLPIGCGTSAPKKSDTVPPKVEPKAPEPVIPTERYAIKNFKLGMSYKDFSMLKPNVFYQNHEKNKGKRYVYVSTTIANITVKVFFIFTEYSQGELLDCMMFDFQKYDWTQMKEALIAKYGQPKNERTVTKSNAMGASWSGVELQWDNGLSTITAEQLGGKVDESAVRFDANGLGEPVKNEDAKKKINSDI